MRDPIPPDCKLSGVRPEFRYLLLVYIAQFSGGSNQLIDSIDPLREKAIEIPIEVIARCLEQVQVLI